MRLILKYMILPAEITPFEAQYLKKLNKIALIFFFLHIPAFMAVAWASGTSPLMALGLSLFVMIGPSLAYLNIKNPRTLSVVYGITAMLMGGLLVHFGQGPVQIEMHFYFFALLAMLCMFANPLVNIAAAVTVALHHLIVWLILPSSVFNYEAQWWVVLVHAAFVILETIAACYISRQFFDNVIGLEKILIARTESLRQKQRDMRLILDHIDTGLITIDLQGCMSSEASQIISQWFGPHPAGEKLSTWLSEKDTSFAEWLELGLESVTENMLPLDVSLAQLPKILKIGPETFAVTYQAIASLENPEGLPEKILVIITELTEKLRVEASGRYQAELLALFQQIMRDKHGFIEFLAESDEIIQSLKHQKYETLDQLRLLLHTLKGNAAIFGMRILSDACHELEDQIAEENALLKAEQMDSLFQSWEQVRSDLAELIGEKSQEIEIGDEDYQTMLQAVLDGVDSKLLLKMLESWQLEPTHKRLERIEQQLQGIAQRIGKSNIEVQIEPNDLRFNSEQFAPFWSAFIHVLRNAVDHAIEDSEQRLAQGKPEKCLIKVSTKLDANHFVISVEDDGAGIDWDVLRSKAQSLGFGSPKSNEDIIFLPGVSSRAHVSEFSGRGVGMVAVRQVCESLNGSIKVHSQRGKGTHLEFTFPKDASVYEGHKALLAGHTPNS